MPSHAHCCLIRIASLDRPLWFTVPRSQSAHSCPADSSLTAPGPEVAVAGGLFDQAMTELALDVLQITRAKASIRVRPRVPRLRVYESPVKRIEGLPSAKNRECRRRATPGRREP